MKKMKKLLSMLLAVIMVLAMAAPSFAAPTDGYSPVAETQKGTITIDNPVDGVTYTAYKIFDLTYLTKEGSPNMGYIYTINSNNSNPWYNAIKNAKNAEGVVVGEQALGITLTQQIVNGVGNGIYEVTIDDAKFNAASFADVLKEVNTSGLQGTELEARTEGTGDSAKTIKVAENLDLGYYFVYNTKGALCNLNTTEPNVTIHDKNKVVFDKTDDAISADLGKEVHYTINGEIPDTTGFKTFYDYIITDTMSQGLTFNKNVVVKINNETWTPSNTQLVYNNENGFTLTIPVLELVNAGTYEFGNPIEVTYSAVVNRQAISKIEKNNAKLEYSTNPNQQSQKGEKTDSEDVYSTAITINKHVTGHEDQPLADAQFVLRKTVTNENGTKTVSYYHDNGTAQVPATIVDWVDNQAGATIKTTDNDGKADFSGLQRADNIEYDLIEVKAPNGYNLLTDPQSVDMTIKFGDTEVADPLEKVVETGAYKYPDINLSFNNKVANSAGTILPSTGGIGTTIFYAVGIILMAGAVFFVVRRKRA